MVHAGAPCATACPLDVEPARKGGSRSAKRNGETADHIVEAARTSRSWFDSLEAFGKDPPIASPNVAEKAAGPQNQRYSRPRGRKIRQGSSILTVHAGTNTSAHRASANGRRAPYRDRQAAVVFGRALNDKPRGTSSETSNACMALLPCPNQSQTGASTSSKVSQTPKLTLLLTAETVARRGGADDVDGPSDPLQGCGGKGRFSTEGRRPHQMNQIARIGLDIAKRWFQIHAVDRQLPRDKILGFLSALPACDVALEACSSSTIGDVRSVAWAIGEPDLVELRETLPQAREV